MDEAAHYAELIEQALELVRHVESPSEAARLLNVSDGTVRRWRQGDRSVPRAKVRRALDALHMREILAALPPEEPKLVNRAEGLIRRSESLAAKRRAEGELHFGDVAAGNLQEARERGYDREELLTLAQWLVERLVDSERARDALQRRARGPNRLSGPEGDS